MSTKLGRVASARATPSRRSSPCASAPAGAVRVAVEPEQAEQLAGGPPCRSPETRRRRAPHTSTFSRTESDRNGWLCWNVRASPCLPAPARAPARDVPTLELDRAGGRQVEPREQVDERRLAGPVRADQPHDLVPVQGERHALHRVDTVERAREIGGPERSSGPPILLRLLFCADRGRPRSSGRPSRRPCRRACPALFWIWITRYCRPNTEWSCGEKLTRPESVGTFLNFSIVAARRTPFVEPPRPLDRGHDAVDGGRARHEAARARLEGLRERVDRGPRDRRRRSTRT